jgi:hypothetical protein
MQLTELRPEERLALVALSRAIALADGKVSPDEGKMIAKIGQAIGDVAYRALFEEAAQHLPDEAALKAFLGGIERQAARELIYDTILDMAMSDTLAAEEVPLLQWLDSTWHMSPALELPETD